MFGSDATDRVSQGFKIQGNFEFGHSCQLVKREKPGELGFLNPEALDNIFQGTRELGLGLRESGQILEVDLKNDVGFPHSELLLNGFYVNGGKLLGPKIVGKGG
jgi:hypothetical protein